jgi:CBS domain-containing protein
MLKARDIMTRKVIAAKPQTTIRELARILIDNKISGVPVVDDEGDIVGIVTEHDLISQNKRLHIPTVIRLFDFFYMPNQKEIEEEIKVMAATTVGEICSKEVITVTEGTLLDEIATYMAEKMIHLIPVVRGKKPVGIIGKYDIVRAIAGEVSEQES